MLDSGSEGRRATWTGWPFSAVIPTLPYSTVDIHYSVFIYRYFRYMKKLLLLLSMVPVLSMAQTGNASRSIYQLRIFRYATNAQGEGIHHFLESALLPALHREGYQSVGVFTDLANDTVAVKSIYLLLPFPSLDRMVKLDEALDRDQAYHASGDAFLDADPGQPPYSRVETILLRAFRFAPHLTLPELKGPKDQRVYELRSYESPTSQKYVNKVQMFNEGGEVPLFSRLGFNAVFYGEVLAGAHMPNLMYMTTFEDRASRESHWKTFVDDPEWKALSSKPEYQKNVSRADIIFLRPVPYSDY
jgi:hypothetical protein